MDIKIINLTKKFNDVIAINYLNLTITKGITGIIGENGAGKSTLFRLISHCIYQDKGTILINAFPSSSKEAKQNVFFLSDDPYCPKDENIIGAYKFYSCFYEIDKNKYMDLINSFNLPLKRKVSTFSKGMRRRVFLALALSSSCPILLLDEAFDGLDPLALDYIKEKIVELGRENRTIVIATHNLSSLEKLADRIVLLYKGELQKDGIEEDFSSNLTKYQAMFTKEINEQYLVDKGFEVVSFKKMGSIYNFVVVENKIAEEKIKEDKPLLFEIVPLEGDEVFASRMMLAKKEGKQND